MMTMHPPHFHAKYDEYRARINIETLETMEGEIPWRAFSLVLEWTVLCRKELRQNWLNARDGLPLQDIAPLE
jgi:hypothetical protein